MKYIVYWNQTNKHVYIHTSACPYVRQHGGTHASRQGDYTEWNTYSQALTQANADATRIGVIARDCLRCAPSTVPGQSTDISQ